jgi:hypothetical protein
MLLAAAVLVGCSAGNADPQGGQGPPVQTARSAATVTASELPTDWKAAANTYFNGLSRGRFADLSGALCPDIFPSEHVFDLAERLGALAAVDRPTNFAFTGEVGTGSVVVHLEVGGTPTSMALTFGDHNGVACVSDVTTKTVLWRRLIPDPTVTNAKGAARYKRLFQAGLITDSRADVSAHDIETLFDATFPTPRPCGVTGTMVSTIPSFNHSGDEAKLTNFIGLMVAFCPYIDQTALLTTLRREAPLSVPPTLEQLLPKMFTAAAAG